jgi:hypothetical protein
MGFRQSTRLQERIAPFLVRNLPQGLQVPPEELREAQILRLKVFSREFH